MKQNETKYIERYDYWQCEKCGRTHETQFILWCHGCERRVIASLPLDVEAAV